MISNTRPPRTDPGLANNTNIDFSPRVGSRDPALRSGGEESSREGDASASSGANAAFSALVGEEWRTGEADSEEGRERRGRGAWWAIEG